jgi:hypothetical protein
MALQTGTHEISDLLAVQNQSVLEYGVETVREVLEADMEAHNATVEEMVSDLAEVTSDRSRLYGTSDYAEMVEADEYTRSPTQKIQAGEPVDFPMGRKQFAVGWTVSWFQSASVADMAKKQIAAQEAHLRAIQQAFKRAIFNPVNYSARDRFVDNYPLNIKRFVNADGAPIPNGPNSEEFDGATHSHYVGLAANPSEQGLNTALNELITDVIEHGHGGRVVLYINRGNESAVKALPDFLPYTDPRVIPSSAESRAAGTLDISRLDNRAIGIFGPAEVHVKSWIPANYFLAFDEADPRKPLVFRQPVKEVLRGLRLAGENAAFPLQAQYMEALFGVGVWTRTNGGVLHVGNAEYQAPNL